MALQAVSSSRFIRKTELSAGEYHKNFFKLDLDIIAAVTSPEADRVTPLMSKIYLRLVNAPRRFYERDRVLRFEAELREGRQTTAWGLLCELLGVASATARKALAWLHETGVIGYFAGKNGAGIRVFLNRANSSIGSGARGQKILLAAHTSEPAGDTSNVEAAFSDSFAVSETSDLNLIPRAPKNGANHKFEVKSCAPRPPAPNPGGETSWGREVSPDFRRTPKAKGARLEAGEVLSRLKAELEPALMRVAVDAAAQATRGEMERTREWFETRALPKAIRVAQGECYRILKRRGPAEDGARAGLEVGRGAAAPASEAARPRTPDEIHEIAEMCLALFQAQGRPVEAVMDEISAERGGWLSAEEVPKVREAAARLLAEMEGG